MSKGQNWFILCAGSDGLRDVLEDVHFNREVEGKQENKHIFPKAENKYTIRALDRQALVSLGLIY